MSFPSLVRFYFPFPLAVLRYLHPKTNTALPFPRLDLPEISVRCPSLSSHQQHRCLPPIAWVVDILIPSSSIRSHPTSKERRIQTQTPLKMSFRTSSANALKQTLKQAIKPVQAQRSYSILARAAVNAAVRPQVARAGIAVSSKQCGC